MGVFREQMDRARLQLHEAMSVEAKYFAEPYDPLTSTVLDITVRVHEKWLAVGDLKGTSFNYAQQEVDVPKIIFLNSELDPESGFVISVKPGIAFRIDTPLEPDGITTTCTVAKIMQRETTGFPVPE